MDKEILKYLPLTTVFISALFICGGLYLVGYWYTFEINPFNLMDIWDIPKSFIMPFVLSNIILLIGLIVFSIYNMKINFKMISKKVGKPPKAKSLNYYEKQYMINLTFLAGIVWLILLYSQYNVTQYYWYCGASYLSISLFYYANKISFIKKFITNEYIRITILMAIVTIPIFSFTIGKTESIKTYLNIDTRYISIRTKIDSRATIDSISSFKLLGFLGDNFIISTFDNKRKFILKQADFEAIEIGDKVEPIKK